MTGAGVPYKQQSLGSAWFMQSRFKVDSFPLNYGHEEQRDQAQLILHQFYTSALRTVFWKHILNVKCTLLAASN